MPTKTKSLAFPFQPSLPFCMHQTWIGVGSKTALLGDDVSQTPLAQVVSNVSHLFQTFVLCVKSYQFLFWELTFQHGEKT